MHSKTTEFLAFLARYEVQAATVPEYLEPFIQIFIVEENVEEMIEILVGSQSTGCRKFLERISRAPDNEAGWNEFWIMGAEMTEQEGKRRKEEWRTCVELVRPKLVSRSQ